MSEKFVLTKNVLISLLLMNASKELTLYIESCCSEKKQNKETWKTNQV